MESSLRLLIQEVFSSVPRQWMSDFSFNLGLHFYTAYFPCLCKAFEYRKLLLDYNREVRRATHDTMTNLVDAVGFVLISF